MQLKNTMRRLKLTVLGLLSLVFVLVLGACASQPTTPSNPIGEDPFQPTPTQDTSNTQTDNKQSSDGKTIVYANVEIKLVSTDQQQKFDDDPHPNSPWLLRVVTKERNLTDQSVYMNYSENWRLLLPDGKSVAPHKYNLDSFIGQGIVRDGWIDFPLESKQDANKLVLRLGSVEEYQMDVPLNGKGDLTKYQSKSITPNSTFKYGETDWTVTKVTASLSYNGAQATAKNRYITVELKADNSTDQTFYIGASNYSRLKSKSVTQGPAHVILPSFLDANSKGTEGSITFLMPASETDLTLLFLAHDEVKEASTNFKV